MKKLIVLLIMLIGLAIPASAQITMPYCDCVELTYVPMGPPLPVQLQSEEVWGIWDGLPVLTGGLWQDVGELPYSVPFYGWHTDLSGNVYAVTADVYGIGRGLSIKLSDLVCCGQVVNPPDPLFSQFGIVMTWDVVNSVYSVEVGNKKYVAVATTDASWTVIDLYHGIYGSSGSVVVYLQYKILVPAPDHPERRGEQPRSEVE